ncbi:hypothetical protein OEZ85_009189 [Tetradesmus obliquus]|uniref:TATA element modulatory factor 1 TATA binding domain-containing protein n=1 Tax=Tetradesmus obliquus TaxID=3088 RepID=A0ABY8TLL8_TETOB|nr:hypothetical protein OEZ85_009189 [Tetradesmus obliquus]
MAEAALGVKNMALDTLSGEYDTLKQENSQLVNLATAKGGDQVPLLMRSLAQARLEAQHAALEAAALRCRLEEETGLRQDLERELEDTAAAAQELWESMQAVYSEAADSRAPSRAGSAASDDGWGTPPGAASPTSSTAAGLTPQQQQQRPQTPLQQGIAAAAAAALAAAAAAAEQQQRQQQQGEAGSSRPATPVRLTLPGTPAAAAAAGGNSDEAVVVEGLAPAATAAAAAAVGLHVPLTGILTPLEDKLQSLSSKLVGLVSWLDARDTASPGSTPRSSSTAAPTRYSTPRLATAAASPAGAAAAAGGSASSTGLRLGLLPLGSPVGGSGELYGVAAALDAAAAAGPDSPRSSAAKRRPSPRMSMAASLAAAAAAGADVDAKGGSGAAAAGNDTGANRAADVCRVKDS